MKKYYLIVTALAAAGMAPAQAGTLDQGNLSVTGFGTLGVARSDTDEVQFARYNQAVGVRKTPRIGLDSNLGLQASYQFSDSLSGTAQLLTRKNTSPEFTTDLTWAFLRLKVNDEFAVRAGRIGLPVFMITDYQNVGYANTMMRPPIELYGQDPVESIDGADFTYQRAVGDTNVTLQGFAGVSSGKLFVTVGAKYRAPSYGFAVTAERGPVTVRLAHMSASLTSHEIGPLNGLVSALTASGFAQLGRDFELIDKRVNFTAAGLTTDWNNIVLQAEYARRRPQSPVQVPPVNAWYLMGGYRIGKVLPYYAHADYRNAGSAISVPAALGKFPPLAAAVAGFLAPVEQSSNLVGVRWDFAQSVALKVQADRVHPRKKTGSLTSPRTGAAVSDVTVIGASLDFVF
ncbi:MAG: porin [Pseudomonadota bacterium]